ncbi:MAG: ester cyclase [Verrucomicrobiales bacterium]
MTTKDLAHRWFTGIWNARNPAVIHELMHSEIVGCTEGGMVTGPEDYLENMDLPFTAAFPDLRVTVQGIVAEGDDAVVRWSATGTHARPFGPVAASGRSVTYQGMTWLRVHDGKIREGCDRWNLHALLELLTAGTESATVKLAR